MALAWHGLGTFAALDQMWFLTRCDGPQDGPLPRPAGDPRPRTLQR